MRVRGGLHVGGGGGLHVGGGGGYGINIGKQLFNGDPQPSN